MNATAQPEKWEYCRIGILGNSNKNPSVWLIIDDGKTNFGNTSDDSLKDSNGETVFFKSIIDAMNFLGNEGWECFKVGKDHLNMFFFKRRIIA